MQNSFILGASHSPPQPPQFCVLLPGITILDKNNIVEPLFRDQFNELLQV